MLGAKKAATREAEPLVVGFSCKVEAQFGDFSIAAFKELVYAPRNEVFVNLDFDSLVLACALLLEACFDVHVHGIVLVYWLVVGCGKIACQGQVVFDIDLFDKSSTIIRGIRVFRVKAVSCFL